MTEKDLANVKLIHTVQSRTKNQLDSNIIDGHVGRKSSYMQAGKEFSWSGLNNDHIYGSEQSNIFV